MRRSALVLALVFVVCGGPLRADSFEEGLRAFRAGEPGRAHDIWLPLAGEGDAAAQYSLGKLFEHGEGPIPQDLSKAVHWYRSAAAQGLPAAQNNLALMYAQGRGVTGDLGRALELWRAAGEQSYPWAQYNLGLAYFRGQGVAIDQAEAALWFRRAANGGLAEAQFIMGQLRREGLGLDKDEGRALAWYHRAAEQGHLRARKQANALRAAGVEPKPAATEEAGDVPVQELAASLPKPRGSLAPNGSAVGKKSQGATRAEPGKSSKAKTKTDTKAKTGAEAQGAPKTGAKAGSKPKPNAKTDTATKQPTAPTQGATKPNPNTKAKPEAKAPAKHQAAEPPSPKKAEPRARTKKPEPTVESDNPDERQIAKAPAKAADTTHEPPEPAAVQGAALPAEGEVSSEPKVAGGFRVWLASAGSKAQATKLWRQVQDRHPDILSEADVDYGKVDLGGQTLFRVLVGPLASAAEAEQLCERLRKAEPEAFCKVRAD